MTDIWPRLAEPFPDSEVKQRPGRGSLTFSYIDARAVMQRLDDVLTPSGWDFTSTVIPGSDVVHGVLTIGGVVREDYGYPNSDHDEEPIKAASSDALKRCGVMFGIGRHLYTDNSPSAGRVASSPARPATTVVPDDPYADLPNEWEDRPNGKPTAQPGEDTCPEHELEWVLRPGGISKGTGKPYDPFWACPSDERPYCKNRPSKAWAARHEG